MKKEIRRMLYRCHSNVKKRTSFLFTFLLTYVITSVIVVIPALSELSDVGNASLTFHKIQLPVYLYLWSIVTEAITPTTITFCSTVMIFQMNPEYIKSRGAVIVTCISLLAALYVGITHITNNCIEISLLFVMLLLNIIPIMLAYSSYIEPRIIDAHKREKSDGSISGSIK